MTVCNVDAPEFLGGNKDKEPLPREIPQGPSLDYGAFGHLHLETSGGTDFQFPFPWKDFKFNLEQGQFV